MALTRHDDAAVRLPEKIFAEAEHLFEAAGRAESTGLGGYSDDGAQDQRREAEKRIALHHAHQPGPANGMLRQVTAKRIDQDIHVRQNHLGRFMRST